MVRRIKDQRLPAFRFLFYELGVRFFPSSLPDLIRQSIGRRGLLRISERLSKLHLCMDHRVKPGGDEIKWNSLAKRA
jgi:hypothetical protein